MGMDGPPDAVCRVRMEVGVDNFETPCEMLLHDVPVDACNNVLAFCTGKIGDIDHLGIDDVDLPEDRCLAVWLALGARLHDTLLRPIRVLAALDCAPRGACIHLDRTSRCWHVKLRNNDGDGEAFAAIIEERAEATSAATADALEGVPCSIELKTQE